MDEYDLVIIGGGPAGLALATYCSKINKKIIIIDKENDIGGCHRVRRIKHKDQMIFTEHGPRIYSSSYLNFIQLLKDININFSDLFTPYHFTMSAIGGETLWTTLTYRELFYLAVEFMNLIINDSHGHDISMKQFTSNKQFKKKSADMIDKLCRLTDGADMSRYTLNEFLNLFNQQFLYSIYQPRLPNDVGLFNVWKKQLLDRRVTFELSSDVVQLISDGDNITSIQIQRNDQTMVNISGKQFIIAIPPLNMVKLLRNSKLNAFGDIQNLTQWAQKTAYIDYLSITFHWDKKLTLPKVYGFPRTEWGVAYIILTDYMKIDERSSSTVISVAVTIVDHLSSRINKTANDCTKEELIDEVFYQLLKSYPNLPSPTLSILSPGVEYDRKNKKWVSHDTAYIATSFENFIPFKSKTITNLYNLGTHNGQSAYKFTSMEAAVSNALKLSYDLYPELKHIYHFKSGYTVRCMILFILLIVLVVIVYKFR